MSLEAKLAAQKQSDRLLRSVSSDLKKILFILYHGQFHEHAQA